MENYSQASGNREQPSSPSGSAGRVENDKSEVMFDFTRHRKAAEDAYDPLRDKYAECAATVRSVLEQALKAEGIKTLPVQSRGKDVNSLGEKASRREKTSPNRPRYPDPLQDITDLAGARVIVFLLSEVEQVNRLIEREFRVIEKENIEGLFESERVGYQSVHFLVAFSDKRHNLPEYQRFAGYVTEIQVRTVLQHAWAEIEHGIQYKSGSSIPEAISRRFLSLAGLIEVADREFQAISEASRP
jgi:putative GTP pyrophosphokinase